MSNDRLDLKSASSSNFHISITRDSNRPELWVAVDNYFIPDASDNKEVICLGLGALDANEFDATIDDLKEQLEKLRPLAKKYFAHL